MNPIERATEALSYLGSTPEEFARGFALRGVRGERNDSSGCPLAVYLKLCGLNVRVLGGSFEFEGEDAMDTGHQFTVPDLEEVVLEFVQNFDSGLYPELEVA